MYNGKCSSESTGLGQEFLFFNSLNNFGKYTPPGELFQFPISISSPHRQFCTVGLKLLPSFKPTVQNWQWGKFYHYLYVFWAAETLDENVNGRFLASFF